MSGEFDELIKSVDQKNGNRITHASLVLANFFHTTSNNPNENGVYIYAPEIGDPPEANNVWDWATDDEGKISKYESAGTLPEWLKKLSALSTEEWTDDNLRMLGFMVSTCLDSLAPGEFNG